MCEFESLYYGDDGYVVRCKHCGHYQVAFISTMLSLNERNFQALYTLVQQKCQEADYSFTEHSKTVILKTPCDGVFIMLTRNEARRFSEILEEADNEAKSLALIRLFNTV
ncbi:MAG: DUF6686 family protein [Bacteroidota bacterium]